MKLVAAFFRLIRWPNLLFIVLTQFLFYYCIYVPLLIQPPSPAGVILFFLLSLSSILIAAGGYIINDYFDQQIDAVNRPGKLIVGKLVKRRWAILWHWVLSAAGLMISVYISYRTGIWLISLINFICVILLWFYSTTLKRKLLSGNIAIAFLTAWVIGVIFVFAGTHTFLFTGWKEGGVISDVRRLFKFALLYAGFAFIMTIIREVIKDAEDMEGDRKYDCKTMPITWGIPAAKVFTGVWITMSIATLGVLQLYVWLSGRQIAAVYIILFIILPLIILLRNLYRAETSADYHRLSSLVKIIILAGILSMPILKFTF
ncbi:MAG: geranylgeranylglycerol-phosphate geranylgeranyltransferase [Ferruginibacter sp.]